MKRALLLLLLSALVAMAPLAARPARAQSKEDVAKADALFHAAKALVDAGQYADACAKFAESKRLAPGLGVTLYLADCYEHIGRTASAWTEFRAAEGLARQRNDKRADVARDRAQALEQKLDRMTIVVAPTVSRVGLQVLRDGVPVPQEEWGLSVPVDPGEHVVVVSAEGHKGRTLSSARLGASNDTSTVTIDSIDEPVPAAPRPPAEPPPVPTPAPTGQTASSPPVSPPPPPAPPPSDSTHLARTAGIGVAALGVVGVGVGSVFGILAKSKLDESNADNHCDTTNHCDEAGLSLRQDAESRARTATIAFAVGGVALAAGVVLYVTASRSQSATSVAVAPAPMTGGGGALLRVRF